ncbi:uncharacterized protein I303_107345 [Kwoniella dejecticola CBS 10117]|uniref:RRM domain-containing protein n=1 Tax=Kwoniella dejecticola CBS 10117 TaxID=1296121 RepID=A0A1A5ZZE8_9TREE|nr:uncharacterized protein I303_06748 [Kwoniella dejecticola CBS 10117]OBR83189.1 hypothetical protein I303_06748 [Kwoniella dejecticola CBS 10117]
MAYNYSNPYQSTSSAPARIVNPPTTSATSQARQVLFSGLPVDITEKDLRELLLSDPLRLSPITTSVTCFSNPDGRFCGVALVYVANAADAEKIRLNYSGQQIDGSESDNDKAGADLPAYTMAVQHILPANQTLTSSAQSASAPVIPRPTPSLKTPKAKSNGAGAAAKGDEKPAGLKLLARLSRPGQPKEKQLALLEKQKANLARSGASGTALLTRLQGGATSHASPKSKAKAATGNAKVGRAKAKASKSAMDIDKPASAPVKKEKPKPKTQAELDEEMRAYERARRFA